MLLDIKSFCLPDCMNELYENNAMCFYSAFRHIFFSAFGADNRVCAKKIISVTLKSNIINNFI